MQTNKNRKKIIASVAIRQLMAALCTFMTFIALGASLDDYTISLGTNSPRPGDRLKMEEVPLNVPTGPSGRDMLWDFSCVHPEGKSHSLRYILHDDDTTLIALEDRSIASYRWTGDSLLVIATASPEKTLGFDIPDIDMVYGMTYGDHVGGYFYGEGTLDGMRYFRQAGYSSVHVEGSGRMITPDGDSLRHVLMVKYARMGTTHINPNMKESLAFTRDSMLLSQDSINTWLCSDSITHELVTCRWYARGYRYPVLTAKRVISFYCGVPVDSVSACYYSSPSSQIEDITDDELNERWREVEALEPFIPDVAETGGSGTKGTHSLIEQGLGTLTARGNACDMWPRLIDGTVTISYRSQTHGSVNVAVYTPSGVQVYSNVIPSGDEYGSHDCDLSGLSTGEHILTVVIGDDIFSFKIFKK